MTAPPGPEPGPEQPAPSVWSDRSRLRLDELLQEQKPAAVIARHEFCPYHPDGSVERYAQESDLRKPRPGMLLRAAEALGLDLFRSWMIGDAPRDVEAGKAAGLRTILFTPPGLAASPG